MHVFSYGEQREERRLTATVAEPAIIGRGPLLWLSQSALRWLPWMLVLFFVALGLRWDRYVPKLPILARFTWRLQSWMRDSS